MTAISKQSIEQHFRRSRHTYHQAAVVQQAVARRLATLLPAEASRILEIGCGTGLLTAHLAERYSSDDIFVNDLVGELCTSCAQRFGIPKQNALTGDAEAVELPSDLDLVVSASTFQWFASPGDTIRRIARAISPGGQLIFSTFAPDNLSQVAQIAHSSLSYISLADYEQMLSPFFRIRHSEHYTHTLHFEEPIDIVRHLHNTGVNASQGSRPLTRSGIDTFCQAYEHLRTAKGFPLTYSILLFAAERR